MTIQLENLRAGEKVVIVIRRHWIVFLLLLVYLLGGFIFSMLLFVILEPGTFSFLLFSIFWMFYALFLFIHWINYELDIFVFTNNRVICVEQKSFLNRTVGETTLDKVQEVGIQTKGLFANILDYGTLSIITAGSTESFDMSFSPKPLENQRFINNLVDKYRDELYGGITGKRGKQGTIDGVIGEVRSEIRGIPGQI